MKNKIFNKILFLIIIFSTMIFALSINNVYAKIPDNYDNVVEEKKYYNGTIDDDFSSDKIIVILSKKETNKYKNYTISDFPEIDCKSVIDLTSSSNELLKNENNNSNEQVLIDSKKFNRILCLELSQKSKENVLIGIKELEKRKEILSAEPCYFVETMAIPNDSRISEQWGLSNANVYKSWDISQNANQVIVGVLDTGIDASHSDLTNNIYRESNHNLETTLHRDFTTGVESGTEILEPIDSNGHGTHVAGIIGACGNNNMGISGVCWNVKLVSLKVLNSEGKGDIAWIVNAINYAASNNIPILNCSLGSPIGSAALENAIESYQGLLVCAAGNSGDNIDVDSIYPASYDYDNILTVGAIDSNNNRSNWKGFTNLWGLFGDKASNYGQIAVDVYAPGTGILSTYLDNTYKEKSGTSMAAPFVTGTAALLLASNSNLTTDELKNAIINGADAISIEIPGTGCSGNKEQIVSKLNVNKSIRLIAFKTNSSGEKIIGTWFDVRGDLNIPNIINDVVITSVGNSSFKGCTNLKSIIIPNSVTNIDTSAFENCYSLQSVILPNNIISIGNSVFKGCTNLKSIIMPNTITNIDSSAFENCYSLQSVTLPNNIISIGDSVFKGCASLESISIPNSVTHIDTSAFEGCSYLQSVRLPNNLIAIGSSAFKGCASLARITIPNTVTNIDTSAFEGCSYLQSVTLSNNLNAIGTSAFKGCGSLERIVIPLSVQYIDDEAFKNCSSLSVVTVNRRITNITNLGVSVFDGCNASLKIIVPTNRIAEYKNKEYWSSYRNKIMPSEDYTELEIDCEGNVTESLSLSKATNELYKLNVNCSKSYKINANSSKTINIIIYDANMNVISSGSNTVTQFLGCGTYYISFEFDDTNASGTFEIGISLTWTSSNILLNKGTNNIKNSMHLNNANVYHCSYKYLNNQGEGFYRFSLNVGSNIILPEGTIKIYSNINKTELLNRYGSTGINEQAITYNGENELYVFLPENGYYYIDVVLPKSTYSLITLTIEQVEKNDINYQNRLATIGFDELFDNKTVTNYFEEVTISHRSVIELDVLTSGIVNKNIPIYIFEKHRDPGYEPGDNHYYLVLEYTNNITSINMGPVFTVILNPGTYYIGYSDNFDKVQIQFALRRKVNTDLNIDGTLVTDPARNQGFPLGSEVTFNNGSLLGNTITEGFTRNLYLMVEDRLRDPISRLDYDWYSSNENVAKVTKYGTVLALNVIENTTVTIYAINKDDPSIVYKKDFIILKETKTEQIVIECNMSYSYSEENGMYTLELDFTNSPYPWIQYYTWSVYVPCQETDITCGINMWGEITASGPGYATLTGTYTINPRVTIIINLTITE